MMEGEQKIAAIAVLTAGILSLVGMFLCYKKRIIDTYLYTPKTPLDIP